jgi:hypothetical protein
MRGNTGGSFDAAAILKQVGTVWTASTARTQLIPNEVAVINDRIGRMVLETALGSSLTSAGRVPTNIQYLVEAVPFNHAVKGDFSNLSSKVANWVVMLNFPAHFNKLDIIFKT